MNEGFRGIGITKGQKFTFSTYARVASDDPQMLSLDVLDSKNQPLGHAELAGFSREWKKLSCAIESTATEPKAKLQILAKNKGVIDLDMISLFPVETFKNRPNGLRPDLAQLVADLKPRFVRFPGGCIVEGRTLANRYRWKDTISDLAERKLIMNRWNTEFPLKDAPDYFQSFGLGFFEYFQFCEDIGAKPLPILNCGMACEFNSGELCPVDQLEPYIQDAVDLIEFANGPATSGWGAKRAAMGHPEPFGMTMLGVGNEQWGPQYFERYIPFAKAIKAKYPDIQLVSGAGPDPDGKRFDDAWARLRELHADLIDEHYYRPPDWFYAQVHRYDNYDRSGPKVFAGEFAAHPKDRHNNWEGALAEAALRTGLERNSDVVKMSSYAPLFAHVDAWQWGPDMIWFDNLRAFGTPSYYAQKVFANNMGDHVIPAGFEGDPKNLFVSGSIDGASGEVIVKIVNADAEARAVHIVAPGVIAGAAKIAVIAADPSAENTLDDPTKVSPKEESIQVSGSEFDREFSARSVTVMRLKTR
jgi:alpha-L-arabinofuranosidase